MKRHDPKKLALHILDEMVFYSQIELDAWRNQDKRKGWVKAQIETWNDFILDLKRTKGLVKKL